VVYNLGSDQDRWAYFNKVKLDFSRLGKPTDNPFIESFNGKFREGCLNRNWFLSFSDVRAKINLWRQDYNHNRPHSSLDNLTPVEFEEKCKLSASAKGLCLGYIKQEILIIGGPNIGGGS
jgi:transposase InsO family protein